jgi:hypothetical protein
VNQSELKAVLTELKQDINKMIYVNARAEGMSINDALARAHRSKAWFYSQPKEEQERLEAIAAELAASTVMRAIQILEESALLAAKVKADGLRSRDERVRQNVATEILDRNIGKPTSQVDVTSNGKDINQPTVIILPAKDFDGQD